MSTRDEERVQRDTAEFERLLERYAGGGPATAVPRLVSTDAEGREVRYGPGDLVWDLLVAVGHLVYSGVGERVRDAWSRKPGVVESLCDAVPCLDFSGLGPAAVDLLTASPDPDRADAALVLEALRIRDEAEFVREATRHFPGQCRLTDEQESELIAFDDVVRPELSRLIPLGEGRVKPVDWVAPECRRTFWWRFHGSDVPPDGQDRLVDAALVLSRFPELWGKLQWQVAANVLMDEVAGAYQAAGSAGEPGSAEPPTTGASDEVAPTSGGAQVIAFPPPSPALPRAAGFEAPEPLSFRDGPDFDVTLVGHRMVVDVLIPLAHDRVPVIDVDGLTIAGTRVAGGVDRFEFVGIEMRPMELRVPLASGLVTLPLADGWWTRGRPRRRG